MLGQHQENNAGLAVTAAHLLAQTFPKITDKSTQEGIEETHWPGRSEWIGNNIYLDGAHNPQGIASLKQVLKITSLIVGYTSSLQDLDESLWQTY